jgi:carbon-monoxide dehydrogenase iron sulfur subunit
LRVLVRRDRCLGCRTCELACALWRDSAARRLPEAVSENAPPRSRIRLFAGPGGRPFPSQCRQCVPAPCVLACPTGALRQLDGSSRLAWVSPGAGGAGDGNGSRPAHVAGEGPAEIGFRHELCIGCFACLFACPFGAISADSRGRVPVRCDACAEMEYAACVDSCPVGALVLADPASWNPADGWDPFLPFAGRIVEAGNRPGRPERSSSGRSGGAGSDV